MAKKKKRRRTGKGRGRGEEEEEETSTRTKLKKAKLKENQKWGKKEHRGRQRIPSRRKCQPNNRCNSSSARHTMQGP